MIIVPSPFVKTISELKDYIARSEGLFDRFQIDINDGTFKNNPNFNLNNFPLVETKMKLDAHLMVDNPIKYLDKCKEVHIDRAIGQIEHMGSGGEFVKKASSLNLIPGMAIDIDTPLASLDPNLLEKLGVVLLMSYQAGIGGQKFNEIVLDKITALKELRLKTNSHFNICIDGGVWVDNISKLKLLGVDEVAIGTLLFDGNMRDNLKLLKSLI